MFKRLKWKIRYWYRRMVGIFYKPFEEIPVDDPRLSETVERGPNSKKVYNKLVDIIMDDAMDVGPRVTAIKFHQESAWGKAPASIEIREEVENEKSSSNY
jgi:hypothetical protein